MKKQAFPGHKLFTSRLQSSESTVTWWPSGFGQFETFNCFFLGVSDIG